MSIYYNLEKRATQLEMLDRALLNRPYPDDGLTVACMPGEEGWDTDYFSMEIHNRYRPIKKIIAIECDPVVANKIREHTKNNPKVEVYEGTVNEFLRTTNEKIDILYLDYYASFTYTIYQDMMMVFKRNLLNPRARVIVAFQSARESGNNQIMQQDLYESAISYLGAEGIDYKMHSRRCMAFNGLLLQHRYMSMNFENPSYHSIDPPKYYQYQGNTPMVTCCFAYNGSYSEPLPAPAPTIGKENPKKNVGTHYDKWLLRNHYAVEKLVVKSTQKIRSMMGDEYIDKCYIQKIKNYYEKNKTIHGSKKVLGRHVGGYTLLIKKAGFDPRTKQPLKLKELAPAPKRDTLIGCFQFTKHAGTYSSIARKDGNRMLTKIK
jgi:hypothetical protein